MLNSSCRKYQMSQLLSCTWTQHTSRIKMEQYLHSGGSRLKFKACKFIVILYRKYTYRTHRKYENNIKRCWCALVNAWFVGTCKSSPWEIYLYFWHFTDNCMLSDFICSFMISYIFPAEKKCDIRKIMNFSSFCNLIVLGGTVNLEGFS